MVKTILGAALLGVSVFCSGAASSNQQFAKCLPAEIDPGSLVVVERSSGSRHDTPSQVSVKTRLTQLKAYCKKGKLFANGKPVYFYNLVGCWGNPPEDYLEVLKRQAAEIQRLKKKYTVIQISCDGSLDPRRIS